MKKDYKYSKFAWPSQITASIIKLDLIIQCKQLPKKDMLSQADAFCKSLTIDVSNTHTLPLSLNKKKRPFFFSLLLKQKNDLTSNVKFHSRYINLLRCFVENPEWLFSI